MKCLRKWPERPDTHTYVFEDMVQVIQVPELAGSCSQYCIKELTKNLVKFDLFSKIWYHRFAMTMAI